MSRRLESEVASSTEPKANRTVRVAPIHLHLNRLRDRRTFNRPREHHPCG